MAETQVSEDEINYCNVRENRLKVYERDESVPLLRGNDF
jgi:hypothetical protein